MSGMEERGPRGNARMPAKPDNSKLPEISGETVVSDAHAKNSRQLLHAHVYNYLVKNGHYATARQFLREADVPLGHASGAAARMKAQQPAGLLPTQLQVDSEETLLLDWWQSFCRLQEHVEETPTEGLHSTTAKVPVPFYPFKGPQGSSGTDEGSNSHDQGSL